jgi:SAM-dependent methyltransferase
MSVISNLGQARKYYEDLLSQHGTTPRGVDWNSEAAQETRFTQLMKICDTSKHFSILDYGSGYGALVEFLSARGCDFDYTGYDISEKMVLKGRELYKDRPNCHFYSDPDQLTGAEYAIASGTFNIKLEVGQEEWTRYVTGELDRMNDLTRRGFSFNLLTKYSDAEYMKSYLYYADPGFFFDYCKTHFAKNVALLHDYGLYDFTVLVRKQL